MDDLLVRVERMLRDRWLRIALGWSVAFAYYVLVVLGEIGRTGSIVISAITAALALPFFRTRPLLSMGLAGTGILFVVGFMTNGYYVQDVTQQSAVLVAVFGGAISR